MEKDTFHPKCPIYYYYKEFDHLNNKTFTSEEDYINDFYIKFLIEQIIFLKD